MRKILLGQTARVSYMEHVIIYLVASAIASVPFQLMARHVSHYQVIKSGNLFMKLNHKEFIQIYFLLNSCYHNYTNAHFLIKCACNAAINLVSVQRCMLRLSMKLIWS